MNVCNTFLCRTMPNRGKFHHNNIVFEEKTKKQTVFTNLNKSK